MNTQALIDQVRIITQDDGTRWSAEETVGYLNQALRDFCHKTLCLRDDAVLGIQAGGDLDLSSLNLIAILRLAYKGKGLPFETEERLDLFNPTWSDTTTPPEGSPAMATTFKSYLYGLYGPTTIRLYPKPFTSYTYADAAARTAASGFALVDVGKLAYQTDTKRTYKLTSIDPVTWEEVTVTLYYARFAADLSAEGPTLEPEILELYHQALVYYAAERAYLKDGQTRNPEKAAQYRALYDEQVALATRDVGLSMDRAWRRGVMATMPQGAPQGGQG